jgi:four helix bundle protein
MATIRQFEDLDSWKKARELTKVIYKITSNAHFSKDFPLKDQIRRAAVSITSNIAEGFEREGNREFIQFLSNAKGSCGEVRSQLYVALDEKYLTSLEFEETKQLCTEVSRLISGLMNYLKTSQIRGNKFQTVKTLNLKL